MTISWIYKLFTQFCTYFPLFLSGLMLFATLPLTFRKKLWKWKSWRSSLGKRRPWSASRLSLSSARVSFNNIKREGDEVSWLIFVKNLNYCVYYKSGFNYYLVLNIFNVKTLWKVLVKQFIKIKKSFPYRELNPGLLGESQLS